jgi:lysozyme family protein
MTFDQAVQVILKLEGGEVNNPDDPGGLTKWGISKKSYPNVDIKNLTQSTAMQIYKDDFWDKLHLDDMPEQIRLIVFDCAVNQGLSRASKILQRVLNVQEDGVIGRDTIAAFQLHSIGGVFSQYATMRMNFYTEDYRWPSFGRGWARRLLNIILESTEMI